MTDDGERDEVIQAVRRVAARRQVRFIESYAEVIADEVCAALSPAPPASPQVCPMNARCLGCERVIYGSVPDWTCEARADCALKAFNRAVSPGAPAASGEQIERAEKYLRDFIVYTPGTAPHPQREKADSCLSFLSKLARARVAQQGAATP